MMLSGQHAGVQEHKGHDQPEHPLRFANVPAFPSHRPVPSEKIIISYLQKILNGGVKIIGIVLLKCNKRKVFAIAPQFPRRKSNYIFYYLLLESFHSFLPRRLSDVFSGWLSPFLAHFCCNSD